MQVVRLKGGSRDGETADVSGWQNILYRTKRITIAESDALWIDGVQRWKEPEDVYERKDNDTFVFRTTVHYKPDVST